jgi:hypothetical protein
VNSNPNGHGYHRDEVQNGQRTSFAEGSKGVEARKEVINLPSNIEQKSVEATVHPSPNLVPLSLLPPAAMALLQQLMATMADKGKAIEGGQEMKKDSSGDAAKEDVPESSATGEARSNGEFGKPPYCYRCLSRGH